jgi:hypothetical protein
MNLVGFDAGQGARAGDRSLGWLKDGTWLRLAGRRCSATSARRWPRTGSCAARRGLLAPVRAGQFFVFLGALIAELGFIGGIVGGAKKNKADKKAKMMAAAERKRK